MPHTNLAASTVATAPSPATSGASLVVAGGEGALFSSFPFYATLSPPFVIPSKLNSEIVKVTSRSTDTFTIVRAQGGTTAKSVAIGWNVAETVIAEHLDLASRTITADTTLTDDDDIILVNATIAVVITAPPVAQRSKPYYIKKIIIDPVDVTFNPDGSEVVDSQLTHVFSGQYDGYMYLPAGGKWWVF